MDSDRGLFGTVRDEGSNGETVHSFFDAQSMQDSLVGTPIAGFGVEAAIQCQEPTDSAWLTPAQVEERRKQQLLMEEEELQRQLEEAEADEAALGAIPVNDGGSPHHDTRSMTAGSLDEIRRYAHKRGRKAEKQKASFGRHLKPMPKRTSKAIKRFV